MPVADNTADQPYVWVRCTCGAGLWRRYADRLEMSVSPRGGQKRMIVIPIEAVASVRVNCEKCGETTVLAA